VAESFFTNLKKEKMRRRKYRTREDARQAIFEYIELFLILNVVILTAIE